MSDLDKMMKYIRKLNPYQIVLCSYGIIILTGTMLLMLPITVVDIEPLSFVDALFMSASEYVYRVFLYLV